MEDIKKKAHDDELNGNNTEIEKSPKKFIPVPKTRKKIIKHSERDKKD